MKEQILKKHIDLTKYAKKHPEVKPAVLLAMDEYGDKRAKETGDNVFDILYDNYSNALRIKSKKISILCLMVVFASLIGIIGINATKHSGIG